MVPPFEDGISLACRIASIGGSASYVGTVTKPAPVRQRTRLRQPGFGQAFSDALKITGILVRQHARALAQREVRIDLKKLCPGDPRVFGTPQMAVAGSQQHATRVGPRVACNALEK